MDATDPSPDSATSGDLPPPRPGRAPAGRNVATGATAGRIVVVPFRPAFGAGQPPSRPSDDGDATSATVPGPEAPAGVPNTPHTYPPPSASPSSGWAPPPAPVVGASTAARPKPDPAPAAGLWSAPGTDERAAPVVSPPSNGAALTEPFLAPADWPAPSAASFAGTTDLAVLPYEAPVVAPPAESPPKRWGRRPGRPAHAEPAADPPVPAPSGTTSLVAIDARDVSAWFGDHQVLDRVSLRMPAGAVTALIGPSGCGKSTFLRILNRMHELIPTAMLSGEVLLDGSDIYDPQRKVTDARRQIGMVFQKPNPFPAMSIYDNVLAGLRLTGVRADVTAKDHLVEDCLTKAGLWKEVRDRLRSPGGGLSGGQQQRLCIARSLAVRPRVLLMDEPCSALDPTSTRRIEETIGELVNEVTIVIVTHNMQQAARVSNICAFFLAEQGTPGYIIEHGPTDAMFSRPLDPRTADYVAGRFG